MHAWLKQQEDPIFELRKELTQLKIEMRECEKWLERAKDTTHNLQESICDIVDKRTKE